MLKECKYCHKQIENKHLKLHERTHTGEKPFLCRYCGQGFVCKSNCTKHEEQHEGKVYVCSKCKRSFKTASSLSHHREHLTSGNPFECDFCCCKFTSEKRLENHINSAHKLTVFVESEEPSSSNRITSPPGRNLNAEMDLDINDESITFVPESQALQEKSNNLNPFTSKKRRFPTAMGPPPKKTVAQGQKELIYGIFEASQQQTGINLDELIEDPSQASAPAQLDKIAQDVDEAADSDGNNALDDEITSSDDDFADKQPDPPALNKQQDCANDAASLTQFPESDIKDCNQVFVSKLWRLTSSQDTLDRAIRKESAKDDNDFNAIFQFLQGKKTETLDLSSFLESNPQNTVGLYISALMLLDYLRKQTTGNLVIIFTESHKFPLHFQQLIQKSIAFTIQCRLRNHHSEDPVFENLPLKLEELISYDFTSTLPDQRMIEGNKIITLQEHYMLTEIYKAVMDMIFEDLGKDEIELLDKSFSFKDRAEAWTTLAMEYLKDYMFEEHTHPFDLLLRLDLEKNCFTQKLLTVWNGTEQVALKLHAGVVERFANLSTNSEEIVTATKSDVDTLIRLLYFPYNVEYMKGKVTFATFQLARGIGISNLWTFLFRTFAFQELTNDSNKKDILRILFELGKNKEIEYIGRNYQSFFSKNELNTSLNGFPAEYVTWMLGQHSLQMEELEKYRILIQWSFSAANKIITYKDELDVKYEPEANIQFQKVRMVLQLNKLCNFFGKLCLQKFIKPSDISAAKLLALKESITKIPSPSNVWFISG